MKLLYRGEVQAECGILGATAGAKCDTVALDVQDVILIRSMLVSGSRLQRAQLTEFFENLMTKFVP